MLTCAIAVITVSAALGAASPWLARTLPPSTTSRGLSLVALLTALAGGFVFATVCFSFLAQIPRIAAAARWSARSLHQNQPVPPALGVAACMTLAGVSVVAVRCLVGVIRDLCVATTACHRLGGARGQLIIVVDERAHAYALSGLAAGRIVVSTAMLDALDADERRALLAHEASHLRHRHDIYVTVSALAAAANPLLRRVPALVRTSVERWADEDAAAHVGSRRLAARAIAKAGLATSTSGALTGEVALAAGAHCVTDRAAALLRPEPRSRRIVASALVALTVLTAVTCLHVARVTEYRFERAHTAYLQQR